MGRWHEYVVRALCGYARLVEDTREPAQRRVTLSDQIFHAFSVVTRAVVATARSEKLVMSLMTHNPQ
jgi:hypothetical protein